MKYFLTIFIFYVQFSYSQIEKDTLIIKFDKSNKEMIHGRGFFYHPKLSDPDSLSFGYVIKNLYTEQPYTLLKFSHLVQPNFFTDKNGYVNPIKKEVDTSYLKDKSILDINFFRKKSYGEIIETFEGKDLRSLEDNPFIWIYNVDEIKNGKVPLLQVWFMKPQNE